MSESSNRLPIGYSVSAHDAPNFHHPQVCFVPYFFREEYSSIIVKGSFMTLAAKPQLVEEGEWLAHHVVEQYRLLDSMLQIIRAKNDKTGSPACNENSCPVMSAAGHTYTWLDNLKRPIKIPACRYIELVQRWIIGKISDPSLFPTDTAAVPTPDYSHLSTANINLLGSNLLSASCKNTENCTSVSSNRGTGNSVSSSSSLPAVTAFSEALNSLETHEGRNWLGKSSGFPESFENDIKSMYRQMMRCYSHLYHGHWLDFWNLSAWKELNTCFTHFINVGRLYGLITDMETEPMQPLINLWYANGLLPSHTSHSNAQQQQRQQQQQQQHQQLSSSHNQSHAHSMIRGDTSQMLHHYHTQYQSSSRHPLNQQQHHAHANQHIHAQQKHLHTHALPHSHAHPQQHQHPPQSPNPSGGLSSSATVSSSANNTNP